MTLRLAADTRRVSASYLLTRKTIEFFSNTERGVRPVVQS